MKKVKKKPRELKSVPNPIIQLEIDEFKKLNPDTYRFIEWLMR